MTPEEVKKIMASIEELKRKIELLASSTTIPNPVEEAFKDRLGLRNFTSLTTSNKSASSENQVVQESGVASYNVLKPPDGFKKAVLDGVTYYFPFYN